MTTYPFVSKTLREAGKPQSQKRNHHCCGVTLQNEGIGYADLDELIKCPQDLEFTLGTNIKHCTLLKLNAKVFILFMIFYIYFSSFTI